MVLESIWQESRRHLGIPRRRLAKTEGVSFFK